MNAANFEELDNHAFEAYEIAIEKALKRVQSQNVIPFCKEMNCRFVSGMGIWMFINNENDEDFSEEEIPKQLYDLLATDIKGKDCSVGCLLEDYDPRKG